MDNRQIRVSLESGEFSYMRWNALHSARHKLLYVPTPKVACTSLKWWFAMLLDIPRDKFDGVDSGESDPELVIHDVLYRFAPQSACVDADVLAQSIGDDSTFRFAVVRNPYQRIFSAWQSKLLLREPQQSKPYQDCAFFGMPMETPADIALGFEGFLEHLASHEPPVFGDPHWTPQVDLLQPDVVPYTCVTQIERKAALLAALRAHLGDEVANPFGGTRANESLLHYSPQFFTKRAEMLTQQLYAADFERFGYSTALPEARDSVTDAELEMAIRAVKLIRGRHERIAQLMASRAADQDVAGREQALDMSQRRDQFIGLESRVRELTAAYARMEEGKDWHEAQRVAWEARARILEAEVADLRAFVAEQTMAIAWHAAERTRWEEQAKAFEARLHTDRE
ncbi:sulfotransferase family 2 domain-containing protein [Burkholderia vietnamiensis]|uniref:sulfotransferase family 2 domain-containing protein n=1 Tax=Burkholderia vietnamiensis TaxID=60552 RepID=UPI002DD41F91|nr:sulfotransferase family 2 domain-containing protein [Burkholderia vietnamiensis]MEC4596529.1 sulfotransferase family 2 domain-containing protein [Burkholderia vietnamiensis]